MWAEGIESYGMQWFEQMRNGVCHGHKCMCDVDCCRYVHTFRKLLDFTEHLPSSSQLFLVLLDTLPRRLYFEWPKFVFLRKNDHNHYGSILSPSVHASLPAEAPFVNSL